MARRALGAAAAKFAMARRVLRGGREHADMGGAICSVAAGHGRNWGCGAVTGCYGTLLMGTREIQGAVVPLVEWAAGHLPRADPGAFATAGQWTGHSAVLQWGRGAAGAGVAHGGGGRLATH